MQFQEQTMQDKVPQIIDPDKFVRLSFPGETLEDHSAKGGFFSVSTTGGAGERILRVYYFAGARVSSPVIFQDSGGLRVIFERLI
ncbi:MAG: hypothetical protein V1820_04660 [archaeon]